MIIKIMWRYRCLLYEILILFICYITCVWLGLLGLVIYSPKVFFPWQCFSLLLCDWSKVQKFFLFNFLLWWYQLPREWYRLGPSASATSNYHQYVNDFLSSFTRTQSIVWVNGGIVALTKFFKFFFFSTKV